VLLCCNVSMTQHSAFWRREAVESLSVLGSSDLLIVSMSFSYMQINQSEIWWLRQPWQGDWCNQKPSVTDFEFYLHMLISGSAVYKKCDSHVFCSCLSLICPCWVLSLWRTQKINKLHPELSFCAYCYIFWY
jgi:hypothetical protein